MSIDQHRYINEALKVLQGLHEAYQRGDSQSLIDYVDRFEGINRQDDQASVSLSVSAPEVKPVITPSVTVASLFEQYEAGERSELEARYLKGEKPIVSRCVNRNL